MYIHQGKDHNDGEYRSIKQDSLDAMRGADLAGIEMEIVNFSNANKDREYSYLLGEYAARRTPNPDGRIKCTRSVRSSRASLKP